MSFHNIPVHTVSFIFLLLTVFSCRKEKGGISIHRIDSGTSLPLSSINSFSPGKLYITGGNDGKGILLYSTDNGDTWTESATFPSAVNDLCNINDSIYYAACDNYDLYSRKANDANWEEVWIRTPLASEYQTDINDVTSAGGYLYMCGGEGFGKGFIGRSTDGSYWDFKQVEHELKSVVFTDNDHGVCAGYGCLMITNDGGKTWLLKDAMNQYWTALFVLDQTIYACSFGGSIIQSNNSGNSWSILKEPGSVLNRTNKLMCIFAAEDECISTGIKGKGFYSGNGTGDWQVFSSFEENDIVSLWMPVRGEGLAAGSNGSIYRFKVDGL